MNTVIWIAQALLAFAFLVAGSLKLTQPRAALHANMPFVEDFTDQQVKGIGAVEVLGAIGLILPAALKIAPVLTPIAAVGLMLTMLGAAATHIRRGEPEKLAVNAILFALALFVAIERFGPHSL
jgi:uncharacterized membrane protein YphA (DoxX/SURF4 family)